jgi:hypothetical protein
VTISVQALSRYTRCGHLYKLQDLESVPNWPTTRQIISRSVHGAIEADLRHSIATGEALPVDDARRGLDSILQGHLAGDHALSDAECSLGNRRIYETMLAECERAYFAWRSVVAPKCVAVDVGREFSYLIGNAEVTGRIEILERGRIRATKIRSRRPDEGEASRDLSFAVAVLAMRGAAPKVTVDYLVTSKEMAYVRQEVDFDAEMLEAAKERVRVALEAVTAGVYLPASPDDWRCRACGLRACCRYVA